MMEKLYFEATNSAMIFNSPWEENGKSADTKDISRAVTLIPQDSIFKQGISFLILMLSSYHLKILHNFSLDFLF